jgi:hypothetical protein
MLIHPHNVFVLVGVEPIVGLLIEHPHFTQAALTDCHSIVFLFLPFLYVEPVNSFEFENLSLLHIP